MATSQRNTVIQYLRRALLVRDGAELSDGQLLASFIEQRDEAAFAALVRRHGPMVWGVCRRVLDGHHDAEDAFQATFLVLVRKAAAVVPREGVANWLHGVAYTTARRVKVATAKRRFRERQVTAMPEPEARPHDPGNDLRAVLDQELSRLPDKYRLPVVLCDLEGRSIKGATRQLGWPQGTLAGRLARGRKMLAKRLTQRGVVLPGGLLAGGLFENAASACVPTALLSSTVKAGSLLVAGQATATGVISAPVIALTEGVLKAMLMTKLKAVTAVLLVVTALGVGGGLLSRSTTADERLPGVTAEQKSGQPPPRVARDGRTTEHRPAPKAAAVRTSELRTGSLLFGAGVNSDAGLAGSVVLNERNFDVAQPDAAPAALDFGFPLAKPAELPGDQPEDPRYIVTFADSGTVDRQPKPDKERLQGTWKIVSTMEDGQELKDGAEEVGEWTFKDTTVRIKSQPKDMQTGTSAHFLRIRLDETNNPKAIDLVEWEKDFDDADERKEGVYALDGDTLKVCYSLEKNDRPTALESKQGSGYVLVVLKRESAEQEQKQPKQK